METHLTFPKFDGTGRTPRPTQTQFLEWLGAVWNDGTCFAGQLPVGSGKSAIARAMQIALGAHVITPSNILIDQYIGQYPKNNYLKGKAHYSCRSGLTCDEWITECEQKPCAGCPYQASKDRAHKEPTFFNPLSLYFHNLNRAKADKKATAAPVLVVDEAHQLPQMLQMLASKRLRRSQYKFDARCTSEVFLALWLERLVRQLDKLASLARQTGDFQKVAELSTELSEIGLILDSLRDDPQNFAIYIEEGTYRGRKDQFLNIRPVRVPRNIVKKLLTCARMVLLSGTLLPTDIEDLADDRVVKFIDLPSPIPKDRRPILYKPTPFPMNVDTDPRDIVRHIESILSEYPNRNTIIHTTYGQSVKLAPHFTRPVLVNTSENKNDVLAAFKRQGGVFLASGCAEGLDLHDDLCRLNIIPGLSRPNLGDPVVQKRKALTGGQKWYDLETLKVTIQQAGRSTRHEKDQSTTVVCDPLFSQLVLRNEKSLPRSFFESIVWRSSSPPPRRST